MPNPTVDAVHINRPLSDLVIAYTQEQTDYIFPKAAPFVPVDKESDHYFVFDKHSMLRNDARKRADGAESAKSDFKLSKDLYDCEVTAVHVDLGPRALKNQDTEAIDIEDSAAMIVGEKIHIAQEADFASAAFALNVWSNEVTGGSGGVTKWSNFGTSDPLAAFRAARTRIKKTTGRKPNKVILGYEVFETLKSHPVIKDQVKYTSAKTMTAAMFAEMIEVAEVLIAEAIQATSVEGDTDETYDFSLAANSAWMGYVNPRPGKMQPSAMYTFALKSMPGSMGEEIIQVGREVKPLSGGAVRIEAQAGWHTKITGPDLGYFFNAII